jgi:hypothetical protein
MRRTKLFAVVAVLFLAGGTVRRFFHDQLSGSCPFRKLYPDRRFAAGGRIIA